MKTTKMIKSSAKDHLVNWLLLFLAIFQGVSQLIEFCIQREYFIPPLLINILISLSGEISKNWTAFSVILILLSFGHLLKGSTLSSSNGLSRTISLVIVNLILCNRVYSSQSVLEKFEYLSHHFLSLIVLSIIALFVILCFVRKKRGRKRTNINPRLSMSDCDENINLSSDKGDKDENPLKASSEDDSDLAYNIKNPFAYTLHSFIINSAEKRKMKREHHKELLEIKRNAIREKKKLKFEKLQKNESEKKPHNWEAHITASISIVICILFIWLIGSDEKGTSMIDSINILLENLLGITESTEQPLMNLLFSVGILFLLAIIILTLFLLVNSTIKVVIYFWKNESEDNSKIQKYGRSIKLFVFGIIEGALRPLLFLPDFLQSVEEAILETNLDAKIDEEYSSESGDEETVTDNADE